MTVPAMTDNLSVDGRRPVVFGPGEGRVYLMGRLSAGSFVLAPGGVPHDFENRSAERAGMLNISVPGDFEDHMTSIARWFVERSPADSRV